MWRFLMRSVASQVDAEPGWRLEQLGAVARLQLSGHWIARQTGLRDPAMISRLVAESNRLRCIRIDTGQLGRWDSALIVFVQDLRRACAGQHIELDEGNLPAAARHLLTLAAESEATPSAPAHHAPFSERVGRGTLSFEASVAAVNSLIGETVLRGVAALGGRAWTRAEDVLDLMRETGPGALIIITIVNLLVGAILAFVGAVQLRRFGAQIY